MNRPHSRSMFRASLAVAAIAVAAGTAHAHGEEEHKPRPPAIDYAKAQETAFGKAADPRRASRVVVHMSDDMRFSPSEIVVNKGDIVRFEVANRGKVMHEMVLGTRAELQEHAALMRKFPNMEHDEPHMVHVPPGRSGVMGWQFTRPGEFWYACLVPGHFEAGMVGRIVVRDSEGGRMAGAPERGAPVLGPRR